MSAKSSSKPLTPNQCPMWFKSHIGMAHLSQWKFNVNALFFTSLAIALGQTLCCTFYGFWKLCDDKYPPLEYDTGPDLQSYYKDSTEFVYSSLFSALYMSNIIMVHLSWLMNQYWCLLAEVYPLFRWPYFSSNAPCLCQDSTQDPTLYLGFMSQAPLGCDRFLDLVFEEL